MELDVLKKQNDSNKTSLKMDNKQSKKPQMEKLRRARINDSLNELKSLVLEAMKKDASRYSKMEKADILEMTVKYLRSAPEKQSKISDPTSLAKYRAGYNECAAEVTRFLLSSENVSDQLRTQLLSHLASRCYTQQIPNLAWAPRAPTNTMAHSVLHPTPGKVSGFSTAFGPPSNVVSFSANLPSPPSSPLNQQDSGLLRLTGASQVLLSNGIPAVIVPNDSLHLLPLTWQNSLAPYDSSVWRPW
uniref:Hes4 n=2 Tax=Nematostella vectensis TaxID=45351 RepID=G9JWJ1_NEMVE|nr:Hes4 [Nematostella vectensis]